jgi:NAD(P)-dependent dehydrogenase (short-subunit alcohol dehydrogenase family)
MEKPLCIIVGVGPGNGLALCNRFIQASYRVAILARDLTRMQEYASEHEDISPYSCDVSNLESIEATFAEIRTKLGVPEVVIYNAGSGVFAAPLNTSYENFEKSWRINSLGLLAVAKTVVPSMVENGGGSLLVTGATASLRGGANFAAFSSSKAAQRNLSQSLARSLGHQGIHVALVIVDGVIDIPRTRQRSPDTPDENYLKPAAIADTFYQLSQQDQSAWTFEIDLRPNTENW